MPPVRHARSYEEIVAANRENMRRRRQNLLSIQTPTSMNSESRIPLRGQVVHTTG